MWFVMDEFGSRIQQSTNPSVAMVPFFYIPTQLAYSVFWPIKELGYKGKFKYFSLKKDFNVVSPPPPPPPTDIITCNFLPKSVKPGLEQVCHSLPWSRDHHISLDDPLWSELDKFKIPEVKVSSSFCLYSIKYFFSN